jgi:hypothetical protein
MHAKDVVHITQNLGGRLKKDSGVQPVAVKDYSATVISI